MNDGGPAFPSNNDSPNEARNFMYEGMTLRDYFAGQVLAGVWASAPTMRSLARHEHKFDKTATEFAYELADAMLKARERHNEPK